LRNIVIAIDGPAAAGKSSTARLVAGKLGYLHIDTGAMYRAMTLKALRSGVDIENVKAIEALAETSRIQLERNANFPRVLLDGEDVTEEIRRPEVDRAVSAVSSYGGVREVMVRLQREMGSRGGIVLEGRDIGTVVFPDAELKIYMVANVDERARRRQKELEEQGIETNLDSLVQDIIQRDEKDSSRSLSPLRRADDAVVLDTSTMTIMQQVEFIVEKAKERIQSE
jgi:cytidylate kinase